MKDTKKGYGTVGLMILTVVIIFCVIAIIVTGFRMIKKKDDAKLAAASDTEYIKNKQEREREEKEEEAENRQDSSESDSDSEGESESKNALPDSKSDDESDMDSNADTDQEQEVESDYGDSDGSSEIRGDKDDKLYLIKGDDKSSNRYEKAKHLSYTTTIKYTVQDLSLLDSYGLKITRNEIFARHGRMFNDQELQEYFQRQQWYVPQTASNDFDDSCLNEVEKYNVELISTYEQQIGGR